MKFTPRSEEQLLNLLPEGEYDFFVKQAEDKLSKSGSEMIKLQLGVLDSNNKEHIIYDYLLEAMPHKIKHFAETVGLEDKYNEGGYEAADCKNKSGRCSIVKQEAQGNFGPKNAVRDYVKCDKTLENKPKTEELFDQEIPF